MLYAQRLAARDPAATWGLWNRAFVLALVGLPRDARADLDRPESRPRPKPPAPPDWVKVIEAYIDRDTERLRLEDRPHRNLAAAAANARVRVSAWTRVALRSAQDVVRLDPECYRAHDVMCQIGGVANLHVATALGPEALAQLLPEKLDAVPSLPKSVRQAFDQAADEPALLEALNRASRPPGDAGEPSWDVFAHLVRETRFVQVYRRLDFLRFQLIGAGRRILGAGPAGRRRPSLSTVPRDLAQSPQ